MIKHLSLLAIFEPAFASSLYPYKFPEGEYIHQKKMHYSSHLSKDDCYQPHEYHHSPAMKATGVFDGGCMGTHLGNGLVMTSAKCLSRTGSQTISWGMTDSRPDPYLVSSIIEVVISVMGAEDEPDIAFAEVYPLPEYMMYSTGSPFSKQDEFWAISPDNKTYSLAPWYLPRIVAYTGEYSFVGIMSSAHNLANTARESLRWPWEKEPTPILTPKPIPKLMPGTIIMSCTNTIFGMIGESSSGKWITRPWFTFSTRNVSPEILDLMIDTFNSPWKTSN